LITVRPESRYEHWVKFPDGQFRKRYNSRKIDKTDMDLLYAFDTMPTLKVSYRPIAKFLKDHEGLFYFITLLILLLYVFCGWVIMVANWFGLAGAIISSNAAYYISSVLVTALPISVVVTYLSNRAEHKWKKLTPDDLDCNTRQASERERKKREALKRFAPPAGGFFD